MGLRDVFKACRPVSLLDSIHPVIAVFPFLPQRRFFRRPLPPPRLAIPVMGPDCQQGEQRQSIPDLRGLPAVAGQLFANNAT